MSMLSSYHPRGQGRLSLVASDESNEDEELLSDNDEVNDELLRELISEIIRKVGNKFVLYTKHKQKNGKRRKLGTHSSRASAERQEKAIHSK